MINVRDLMTDSDFATSYTVLRTKGKWEKGRFIKSKPTKLKYFGPVQPATTDELQQIPEADRTQETMKFMCAPPKKIFITREIGGDETADGAISDHIIWDGNLYKVIRVMNWRHHGYTRAFAYSVGEAPTDG